MERSLSLSAKKRGFGIRPAFKGIAKRTASAIASHGPIPQQSILPLAVFIGLFWRGISVPGLALSALRSLSFSSLIKKALIKKALHATLYIQP
jgi:hypothetical protein